MGGLSARPQRPLCLLDVDGVIALLGSGNGEATFEPVVAGYPVTIPRFYVLAEDLSGGRGPLAARAVWVVRSYSRGPRCAGMCRVVWGMMPAASRGPGLGSLTISNLEAARMANAHFYGSRLRVIAAQRCGAFPITLRRSRLTLFWKIEHTSGSI